MTIVLNSLAITISYSEQSQARHSAGACDYKHCPRNRQKAMKAIRRSIKGEKDTTRHPSLHNSITPKSAIAIQPPKKVIKALYDYLPDPTNTQELGFTKGDFFHVISREDDTDWYEACNPLIPSARGLVPVSYFEIIGKTDRQSAGSVASSASNVIGNHPDSGYSEQSSHHPNQSSIPKQTPSGNGHIRMPSTGRSSASGAMVYGIVQYDFNAERPDELEAKKGEAIIVIAQSNPEWFVAKPIGRLGGPGLIPVSFIEIRDMSTGQAVPNAQDAVTRAGVPKVEEWKKMAADYKNSSITLGKLEAASQASMQSEFGRMSMTNGDRQYTNGSPQNPNPALHQRGASKNGPNGYDRRSQRRMLAPVSASIPRYIFENDKYWYIIECQMEDGRWWELSRIYQKFYDFQIALLQQFPKEATTPPGGKRLLPFMPGPVTYVTDAISNGRRESLNQYVKELLALPSYISRCDLVKELFAPKDGDYELDPDRVAENFRHSTASQQSSLTGTVSHTASRQSSQGQMNGGPNGYGSMGPPQQPRPQNGPTQGNGGQQHYRNPSDNPYQYHPNHNGIKSQPSTLTQASSNSSAPGNASQTNINQGGNPPGALKIKVKFQDDLIAIRVPSEIGFQQLKDKLKDRLKIQDDILISYQDERSGHNYDMGSDRDLDVALGNCQKLILTVDYA